MIQDFFRLSLVNLRKRQLRSWLTIFGIIIGIGSVVALISLSVGLNKEVERQFELFGSDKIFITSRGSMGFGPPSGSGRSLVEEDVDIIKKVDGVDLVASTAMQQTPIRFRDEIKFVNIIGISTDSETSQLFEEVQGFKVSKGRQLKPGDTYKITVGASFGEGNIFDKNIKVGNKLEIYEKSFDIIGIYEEIGNEQDDSQVYMPIDTFREITGIEKDVVAIIVKVDKGKDIDIIKSDIEESLRDYKKEDVGEESFNVNTSEDILRLINQLFGTIQIVLVGIGAISLLVGTVGVMNTMYTSVLERTKEIGIMKAIGAKNSDVLSIFLIESGVLGLVGGGLGVCLGLGMAKIVEIFASTAFFIPVKAYIGIDLIVGALILSFAMGSIAGFLPARKAAKLKPVDALRYE